MTTSLSDKQASGNTAHGGLPEPVTLVQWSRAQPHCTEQRAVCTVEGCFHLARVRGYCGKHYQRVLRWGDPLKTLTIRFEPKFRGRVQP